MSEISTQLSTVRGKHPNSLANLQKGSFKPGQSGNARGRRKGVKSVTHALDRMLASFTVEELRTMDESKLSMADAVIRAWLLKAIDTKAAYADRARDELLDRVLGKNTKTDQQLDTQLRTEYRLGFGEGRLPAPMALERATEPNSTVATASATQDTGTSLQPVQTEEERWAAMSDEERFKAEQAALLKKLQEENYGQRKPVGMYSRKVEKVSMSWEKFESYNHMPRGSRMSENLRTRD